MSQNTSPPRQRTGRFSPVIFSLHLALGAFLIALFPQSSDARGNGTAVLMGAATYMLHASGSGVTHTAFGTNGELFTEEENAVLCSMQSVLSDDADIMLVRWFSGYIAHLVDGDRDRIFNALSDPQLCVESEPEVQAEPGPVAFPVSLQGYPLSTNETWNKCVTGRFTLRDIRNNPDTDESGTPRSCSDYHTSTIWYHPDLHVYFFFDRTRRITDPPDGFVVRKQETFTQR